MPTDGGFPRILPKNALFILGAGRFGRRAVEILISRLRSPIWLIDNDEDALFHAEDMPISRVVSDASQFLVKQFPLLRPGHIIVPSVPYHLAFDWLKKYAKPGIEKEGVPQEIRALLPNTWAGPEGSLLVSYANFLCPEDCSEPARRCTVTGKRRGTPLYERLSRISLPGYRIHIIRSRQLAPGVGGYKVRELSALLRNVQQHPGGKWLVGTACKCHGTISAFSSSAEREQI